MHIVGKYQIHLHSLWNRSEKLTKGSLFYILLKLIHTHCSDNVRILTVYPVLILAVLDIIQNL